MASMRERMSLLDGRLDVHSAPGCGTTITASVPMLMKMMKAEAP
jgi:signal transduction histidine kinase